MVSVTLPCHIDTTNTTKQLSKNVCQNETGEAVTSLTTKCTDNHGGAAQTEVISGALVSGAAALPLLASLPLYIAADDVKRPICGVRQHRTGVWGGD